MGTDTRISIDENATTLIRMKARQLVGRYGFTKSDRTDIEQELTLDLHIRLGRFDPAKGRPATFMRMVVDRRAGSMIRKRKAQVRDYRRRAHSLDELSDENGNNGHIAEPAMDYRRQHDLEIDVSDALASLADELRSVAEDLREKHVVEIARERGCGRETVRRAVRRIRRHFEQRGLHNYLPAHQSDGGSRK
ncbi:MAG: sigma-70 family RNA polymerase sigma factor [Planctomycetota bacterium]